MNKRIEVTKTSEGFVLTPIGQDMDKFSNQEIKDALRKALTWQEEKGEEMTPNEYQQLAKRTLMDEVPFAISDKEMMIIWTAIGLGGEAGEVLELIKKGVFHQHGIDRDRLKKELGDCLWYLAGIATKAGLTLEDIMQSNIKKLKERYPEGFSAEASKSRKESE